MNQYSKILDQIVMTARLQLQQVSSEEMAAKPKPEKWSKKEILGHLIDSAYNNHQRFLRAEQQGNLVFQGYDQNAWVKKNAYQVRELSELIQTWAMVNYHLARLVEGIPVDLLEETTSDHNFHIIGMNRPTEGSASSLGYLIWDYIAHLEHHLSQLIPTYRLINPPFTSHAVL
ncbi:MAG: DinB family protein [Bacteroidota bacterium]